MIYSLNNTNLYFMRESEKGCQKAVATLNIKTSIFNLQNLSHLGQIFQYLGQIHLVVYNKIHYGEQCTRYKHL